MLKIQLLKLVKKKKKTNNTLNIAKFMLANMKISTIASQKFVIIKPNVTKMKKLPLKTKTVNFFVTFVSFLIKTTLVFNNQQLKKHLIMRDVGVQVKFLVMMNCMHLIL